MKILSVSSILLFLGISLTAQNRLSPVLQMAIKGSSQQPIEILVQGEAQVDAYAYQKLNRSKYATPAEFTVAFLNALHQANSQPKSWMDDLNQRGLPYEVLHSFWSVNVIAISASASTIQYLSQHEDIRWVETIKESPVMWDKPVNMQLSVARSINGKENGITAVKADSLWLLGYTGRGQKLLTFDTGVWPNHPTFRDQFLGHHVPLNQAWNGYDSYLPSDKGNAHGTHVTGTCIGLDPANNDTIGLAFNAYFMGTDPIVSNLADIKTLYHLMMAYEWAMNPDGDLSTTHDMPNVINNSWGRPISIGDSVVCEGWADQLLVNVEVAGIISIHSAGNAGPNPSTLGTPAYSNATVVNTFSVGAVDAHQSHFPIANFSSRGPSICSDTGALLIKPEVVAPGVNVRSSIRDADGNYVYGNYQGTSMAAPHVSGVALLLGEAFPVASATEIKEAIYYSAQDLGTIGEDNTYGRGMIDAMAAYRYLSAIYSPTPVTQSSLDIHLIRFDISEYSATCEVNNIIAYFENSSDISFSTVSFEYGFTGQSPSYIINHAGTFKANDSVAFNVQNEVQPGWNEFYVKTVYTGQFQENDTINNTRYVRFWVHDQQMLPYLENFDGTHVFESSMYVGNPDEKTTWDTAQVQGVNRYSNAAVMKLARYSPRNYQRDYLLSPVFDLNQPQSLHLSFDLSYQLKFSGFADSLEVSVSTDCGSTWDAPVYVKGPSDLNTTSKSPINPWVPIDSNDWRTEIIDLSAYTHEDQIMVKLEVVNGQGNHLYLDNINVYDQEGMLHVATPIKPVLILYPNPTSKGLLHFSRLTTGQLWSVSGVLLHTFEERESIDISTLKPGVYVIRDTQSQQSHRLIVE